MSEEPQLFHLFPCPHGHSMCLAVMSRFRGTRWCLTAGDAIKDIQSIYEPLSYISAAPTGHLNFLNPSILAHADVRVAAGGGGMPVECSERSHPMKAHDQTVGA